MDEDDGNLEVAYIRISRQLTADGRERVYTDTSDALDLLTALGMLEFSKMSLIENDEVE